MSIKDIAPDPTKLRSVNGASRNIGNMIPLKPKKIRDAINEYFTLVKNGFLCRVVSSAINILNHFNPYKYSLMH